MHNLNEVYRKCYDEVVAAGIKPGHITRVSVNKRAHSFWGRCKWRCGAAEIEIVAQLLEDQTPMESLKNTMIHEILHTVDGCQNHGPKWQHCAAIMNRKYGYHIQRCTAAEEKQVEDRRIQRPVQYRFICTGCGQVIERRRRSEFTEHYDRYRCGQCSGRFVPAGINI